MIFCDEMRCTRHRISADSDIAARVPSPALSVFLEFWNEEEEQLADTAETKRHNTETSVFICEATRHSSKVNRP